MSSAQYLQKRVYCLRCGSQSARIIHRAYEPGETALIDCGSCGDATAHRVGMEGSR
jgi:transcription elongation factor Elf1